MKDGFTIRIVVKYSITSIKELLKLIKILMKLYPLLFSTKKTRFSIAVRHTMKTEIKVKTFIRNNTPLVIYKKTEARLI